MLSAFELIAVLLVLTATFGWINHRFLGLPDTVGLLAMGLAASLVLLLIEISFPNTPSLSGSREVRPAGRFQEGRPGRRAGLSALRGSASRQHRCPP
jgi:hypothetical protein